jgi:hypothetical protein
MSIVTKGSVSQHTELLGLEHPPMPVQYPLHRPVDLDDADGRTPLRHTDSLSNLSYHGYTTIAYPGVIELNVTLTGGGRVNSLISRQKET